MKVMIVLLIGIVIGAFCAIAATNAMGKRNAHGRAVMVTLTRHLDALRAIDLKTDCRNDQVRTHLDQIAAASRDIDYAFAANYAGEPAFARRSAHFRSLSEAALGSSCDTLPSAVGELADDCQRCHRQFR